ncbi:SusD/RagB family nutrient-binding outer membrane lipoprotein [Subsaxibacter sp. CAU 1640]|uniref:SusD/RagB family nutrient-binding outer membrane lipoprotein n=1 Tax=Subsaxibacter sp. CAU 1640 TaxID=2933271 RepID=UPI002006C83F|nr:SusD/RagB family nutrient-binding outer membrane lipoprotein [Subsaxibacter sp. CAU 1640]MCK7591946.1 SusD/RagB family nutrient-binding outer membrane lipoprotein [Subsaxibacter sp. CAU 1640]
MKKYLKYISIACTALFLASCSDSYLDVNEDTNSPTIAVLGPELVLPVGQYWSAEIHNRDRYTNTLGNMFMVNWSQADGYSWYNDEFLYNVTTSFYSQIWDRTYRDALKNYRVLQAYQGDTYSNYRAIGKIMESYHFQILVDIYGDIPYFEALGRGVNPTPSYDDAQAIYEDLVVQLDAAMEMIDNATESAIVPSDDDTMFHGDMETWKKFANTIKLRVLVRQSGEGSLNSSFAGMSTIGFITDDVTVDPGYAMAENQQSPFWNAYGRDSGGNIINNNNATCATPFALDFLEGNNDPRVDYIYEHPATGHLGVPQGIADYDIPVVDQYDPIRVSNIGPGLLKSATQPAVIFTAADSYFLQAEAIFKGYLPGDAQVAYENGITASFDYLGAPGATDYYTQALPNVGWNASSNKMRAIITQKWVALNGVDAIQSWFDYNRTGFPANLPVSLRASTPDRPVRLFYPSSELTANAANVPSQPNAFTVKIFWAN